MDERWPTARMEDQRTRRRRQRSLHCRWKDFRHEQSWRGRGRLDPFRVGWQDCLGDASWTGFQAANAAGKEGPGCMPTVDGELLYVEGLAGDLACLQVKDGKIIWQRSLQKDFGGSVPRWSYRGSPLVDGDRVICTPGGEDATLVALGKLTGMTIWKSQVPGSPGAAYASAIAIDFDGQRQYVQLTQKALVAVAASDGK